MLNTCRGKQWLALIALALLGVVRIGWADLDDEVEFDIPPQPMDSALLAFSEQADVQLVVAAESLVGIETHGVTGRTTTRSALTTLLGDSGLEFKLIGNTVTVTNGERSEAAPSGKTQPASSLTRTQQSKAPASQARNDEAASGNRAGQDELPLEEIIVTGSRLKGAGVDGPSPVVIFTREDIERSGAVTVREVLNAMTQNAVALDESGNSSFLGASTVQLRGLPVGTTLLLLNGRRLGASGAQVASNFFDLNNIPLQAVERIEVLTDSGSAVYGADAIGGVVNVILRSDFDGAGASGRFGTSAVGDATERNASFALGGSGESASGLLIFDYYNRDPLRGSDRDLTSTADFTRFGGIDFRSAVAYPANVYSLDGTPLPGLTSSFAGVPAGTDGTGLTPADFQATDGALNVFDGAPYSTLMAEAERTSVFAGGRYLVSPAIELFAEALYTNREQIVQLAPDGIPLGQFGFFTVPAENPFNPFGVPVGVDYRFVEMGPRSNESTTEFSRFLLGASGSLLERFDWEAYWLADRDDTEVFNRGYVNAFLNAGIVQQYLSSTDPDVALNVFSTTGNNNPATLAAILDATQTTDDFSTSAQMAEAVVRGPLFELPAGPLSAVLGVNVRREKVAFLSPLAGDLRDERDTTAAFAEISVPLVGADQEIPGILALEFTAALRHDRYKDLESSTNPQFGLIWRLTPSLLIRSSYGEAFKAPTAFDLYFPQIEVPFSALDPARGGELSEFIATLGGNPDLAPEQGNSTTLGFVWEPAFAPGFAASVNGFRLEQEDFITALDPELILQNEALFPERVIRAPVEPTDPAGFAGRIVAVDLSNINFGRLTVTGADTRLEYAFPATGIGEFVATLNGTYIDEYEILTTPGTEPINRVNQANDAGYPVRFKGNAGLSWSEGDAWSASVISRYLASYTDYDGVGTLPSQTLFDAQVSRSFGSPDGDGWLDSLQATIGVVNLTDEQGDFSNNFAGYDAQQSDIRGRFYYVSLDTRF